MVDLPLSPRDIGYEHTTEQFRQYVMQDLLNNDVDFYEFSSQIWQNTPTKPEVSRLFKQARGTEARKGTYFGKSSELIFRAHTSVSEAYEWFDEFPLDEIDEDTTGVTLLHVLEDLFDHDERPMPSTKSATYSLSLCWDGLGIFDFSRESRFNL